MAGRRGRRRGGDGGHGGGGHGGGSERWLVSYADFITLMFVVFTVLFSMARVDATKYSGLAKSLKQSMGPPVSPLGAHPGGSQPIPPMSGSTAPLEPDWPAVIVSTGDDQEIPLPAVREGEPNPAQPPIPNSGPGKTPPVEEPKPEPKAEPKPEPPPKPADPLGGLAGAFRELPGARNGLLGVVLEERGLTISIAGSVLFEPGKTLLRPEAMATIDQVAAQLKGVQYPVMIEGTADEAPVATPGALSPWDLSALRAGAVVRYFVENHQLPSSQFITIGYAGNGQPTNKVTIVVMRKAN